MTLSDRDLLIALHHLPGVGTRKWNQLLHQFDEPRQWLEQSDAALAHWLGEASYELFAQWRRGRPGNWLQARLDRLAHWLERPHHHLITRLDDHYPLLLREARGPLLLHLWGDADLLSLPQIAIVGARKPTNAGRKTAAAFAETLAGGGFAITSGLALGIDAAAHQGALRGGGRTLAVLGTGLDRVYPAGHGPLAAAIAERGALVSEFALGTRPEAHNFPRRNRIISGLSLATLVVEAARASGSLITARLAMEQNREVFAVPGSIYSPVSEGCHQLIRDGATLVESPEQLVAQLGGCLAALAQAAEPLPEDLAAPAKQLLNTLGAEVMSFEELLAQTGLPYGELHHQLSSLELEGLLLSSELGYQRR